ncbi:FAD-dependent monooxygenase [Zobellella taiwanensis]|jgi:2-octaprenylphenol hydroxylase|uniref:FAD-dependent 2-octaprenylphenol hydroxylase n=1 Tax=Zobellella taiwanensis TaxID=347535 RepID=A0A2P7QFN6_9GAMM|nr:FAD-dependent monooxygenase [Zobellella taiwanensis]PSJ36779.1 FAD-dependent 2-octaprenylphenol hydroxylase [Zobellella taiwanensis]
MQAADIILIGGGMVGLSLALALEHSGLRVAVIEGQPEDDTLPAIPDHRVSAINLASRTLLERLDAWPAASGRLGPYRQMEVWEADSPGRIGFSADLLHQPELGHIVENRLLQQSLLARARQCPHIRLHMPARAASLSVSEQGAFVLLDNGTPITGRLLVGADGARSWLRGQLQPGMTEWDYDHSALVATVATAEPHRQTARQIFRGDDILAFLPLADAHQCSIVWSCSPERAEALAALPEAEFNKQLSHAFDLRLGLCTVLGPRMAIPLRARFSQQFCGPRWALIGDAAHTIHPLAGQGVNLGLQDAQALAETLIRLHRHGRDIGELAGLRAFERARKAEAATLLVAMEGLKRLFGTTHPLWHGLRTLGLGLTDRLTPLKRQLAAQALGLGHLGQAGTSVEKN